MTYQEKFEKWLLTQNPNMSREFYEHMFTLPTHIDEASADDLYALYNAGKADQATTIAQLQCEIARLTSLEFNVTTDNIILHGEIAALTADNARLREALEDVIKSGLVSGSYNSHTIINNIVVEALSTTSQEALGETK